mmetsp:Transcript_74094/g.140999  ORF Transcript_74094/g.140999 Transcript_74094/m.140999 type:complete len:489 (-) Transcript_74094:59-1525(-)
MAYSRTTRMCGMQWPLHAALFIADLTKLPSAANTISTASFLDRGLPTKVLHAAEHHQLENSMGASVALRAVSASGVTNLAVRAASLEREIKQKLQKRSKQHRHGRLLHPMPTAPQDGRIASLLAEKAGGKAWYRCAHEDPPLNEGDVINGYALVSCLGGGSYAEAWLVRAVDAPAKDMVMKVSRANVYKKVGLDRLLTDCVFGRLAKRIANAGVADCHAVGQKKLGRQTYHFLIAEKMQGTVLGRGLRENSTHLPVHLNSLADVFDAALQIFSIMDKLRSPAQGIVFWHRDLNLDNVLLSKRADGRITLAPIDYGLAFMCCSLPSTCSRASQEVDMLARDSQLGKDDTLAITMLSLKRQLGPCGGTSQFDRDLVKTLAQDVFDILLKNNHAKLDRMLLFRPGPLHQFISANETFNSKDLRSPYRAQWEEVCKGRHKQACDKVFKELLNAYRTAVASGHDASVKCHWPACSAPLVQSLRDALQLFGSKT